MSRTVWPLRARDVLFSPAVAPYTDLRYPRRAKNLPLGPNLPCAEFGPDWCTHVDLYSEHPDIQTYKH